MASRWGTARAEESDFLREYLRLLTGTPVSEAKPQSPGQDLRSCGSCGARTRFILDPEGVWFLCSGCGAFA